MPKVVNKKLRVLNLYAGVGGNRKLWKDCYVTAVENNSEIACLYKRLYPEDNVIVDDAHQFLIKHYSEFDFIWSSPPCQSHSKMSKFTRHKSQVYPDMKLYQEILFLKHFFKGGWIVENVKPYYDPLIPPTASVGRHLFWSSLNFKGIIPPKSPVGFINKCDLQGKRELQDWLGIHYEEHIYGDGHDPAQILRSCVHPLVGEQILNSFKER